MTATFRFSKTRQNWFFLTLEKLASLAMLNDTFSVIFKHCAFWVTIFQYTVSEAHDVQFLVWSTPPINIDDNGLISMQILSHSITCLGKSKVFMTRNKIYVLLFKNAFLTCPRPTFSIFLHCWLVCFNDLARISWWFSFQLCHQLNTWPLRAVIMT